MSMARSQILGDIRTALGRGPLEVEVRAALEARLQAHPRNLIPARADLPPEERVELFIRMARSMAATVERLAGPSRIPHAVADYLLTQGIAPEVRLAPDPWLLGLAWDRRPALGISSGPARDSDPVAVTGALAAVAETGTLMLASGPGHPTSLNFLPETHIVVLSADRVVGSYEEAWDRLRAGLGAGGLPRTVNFVTGPSRTGDIEQQIQLGAHGPRRLHILLVDHQNE
jgi:L-lactate dehydrogenase complex protein LldG